MENAQALERSPVRAVQRAFDLLALLGGERAASTLSELAREANLPVSTVARLLGALEHAGFVRRDGESRYAPGVRLVQLGLAALRSTDLYELSEPYLHALSEASGETANLVVRGDPANAMYLRQVVSPRSIHHAAWLGRLIDLKKTAVGAALAGKVGDKGYVCKRNTLEPGVTAIAAPVHGDGGRIVAAFSITGPSFRITERDVARYGRLLVKQAALASARLGAPQGKR
jgi:DNA-binding IclR family transcriptional regulator